MKLSEEHVLNEIVKGYRTVIDERYQYNSIKEKYSLPNSVDDAIIEEVKQFFLVYIYPDIERREELNEAFRTLDENIRNPQRLFGLLSESIKLVFKHGRHLPKIMIAGFKALKSFSAASKFEKTLVSTAIEKHVEPPYTVSKINSLIQSLTLKEVEEFMDSTESLFLIMHDKALVKKIQEVIGYLIERMKIKSDLFSIEEVKGLEIGLEMISKGDRVLNSLSQEHQDLLIEFIIKVEKDNLNELFL